MFIFLFSILLNVKLIYSTIIVQNSGLYEIQSDDIAMVFFLTVENTFDCKIPVSVHHIQCIEGDQSEGADYMYLIGGDMDYIEKRHTKNFTLIYPNLYLRNRAGKCIVALRFRVDDTVQEETKEIYFDSNRAFVSGGQSSCESEGECAATDCVVRYSSRRSFYNKEQRRCQMVPECGPNSVYIPKSNICRKVKEPVCRNDLEMIESGSVERCHSVSNLVNFCCHHGFSNNQSDQCVCDDGWTSSTCLEGVYHPTLNLYHMCNIELNSWEKANREKLIMTILVLLILAIALAAKMLLAVCLLNWCCHFIKSRRSRCDMDDEVCGSYNCPYSYCGDDQCPAAQNLDNNKSSRSIKVSFSNVHASSSGEETDVTVSVEDEGESRSTDPASRSVIHLCRCKE